MAAKRNAAPAPVDVADVYLWGALVGAVAMDDSGVGRFEYDPGFTSRGLEIAPRTMPAVPRRIYAFPALNRATFHGLPGLLADALPDKYGNELIDLWLARQGRTAESFSAVERLCYMGARGMGALEFKPARGPRQTTSKALDIASLTDLAAKILARRMTLSVDLSDTPDEAVRSIISVGTSAGGARAKAVVAWNPNTGEVRSGQVAAPKGFEHWILKFDTEHDRDLGATLGYGRIEYAYHKLATRAGIDMMPCRLLEEGGRAHFMTKRFDRTDDGEKLHAQSLCALGHYDYNRPRAHGYEQAFEMIRALGLPYPDAEQQYRRTVFNVIARNQDDHTRNIEFLMDQAGEWRLAPAFDVAWAYNPKGDWTAQHQMSLNGKADNFTTEDLHELARTQGIRSPHDIITEVAEAIAHWPEEASASGVPEHTIEAIRKTHRVELAD